MHESSRRFPVDYRADFTRTHGLTTSAEEAAWRARRHPGQTTRDNPTFIKYVAVPDGGLGAQNTYWEVIEPFTVEHKIGSADTQTFVGRSMVLAIVREVIELPRGAQVHCLHGGLFAVLDKRRFEIFREPMPRENLVKLTTDVSPYEAPVAFSRSHRYGDALFDAHGARTASVAGFNASPPAACLQGGRRHVVAAPQGTHGAGRKGLESAYSSIWASGVSPGPSTLRCSLSSFPESLRRARLGSYGRFCRHMASIAAASRRWLVRAGNELDDADGPAPRCASRAANAR